MLEELLPAAQAELQSITGQRDSRARSLPRWTFLPSTEPGDVRRKLVFRKASLATGLDQELSRPNQTSSGSA